MGRVSERIIESVAKFLDSLPDESREKCALCNKTLTHIVKQCEAKTGAGTRTVTRVLADIHNETAAPEDKVSEKALTERVRYEENGKPIVRKSDNSGEDAALELRKDIKKTAVIATHFTGDNENYTPSVYIESARVVMGSIDLDPASNEFAQSRVKARWFFTKEDDGLSQEWSGNIWLNPPYEYPLVEKFIDKLLSEKISQAVLLTNNSADTGWFHKAARQASLVCFTRGRISFEKEDGARTSPTNGQTFFYYGNNEEKFLNEFQQYGLIVEVVS